MLSSDSEPTGIRPIGGGGVGFCGPPYQLRASGRSIWTSDSETSLPYGVAVLSTTPGQERPLRRHLQLVPYLSQVETAVLWTVQKPSGVIHKLLWMGLSLGLGLRVSGLRIQGLTKGSGVSG